MEKIARLDSFRDMAERVGRFSVQGKSFLIPEMNPVNSHLLAGVFQSYGVPAEVMETYAGLDLGKKHTSGKECFPCVVTLGDILYHMEKEQVRLGDTFDPERYMYFMPEAGGPCRFGMYNKYHRIILDSIPGLER
jgi:predicted nucleotide-binding protein (sugar kinase/HSP70/actin superfamily)